MRILYFSHDFTPHDYRFLSSLAGTAHQVYFLRLAKMEEGRERRSLPETVHEIQWSGGFAGRAAAPALIDSLKDIFQKVAPDLVHAGPVPSCAWLAARAGFHPLISMSWGFDLLYEAKRSTVSRQKIGFTLRRSSVLIGDCEAVRQQAIRYGMRPERIVTFPWGIDLKKFIPAPQKPTGPRFTLLSVRAWEPMYGVDVLAEGFVQAAWERPELHLVMLGRGSLEGKLQAIFRRGGMEDRVSFLGIVPYDALPDVYRAADLYITASRTDGSSVSLMEALACGLPCVVSDIPGNREWIVPGLQGWLFPDGDAGALSATIISALDRREELRVMGEAARQLAEQRADWERNFPQLLRAYDLAFSSEN